MSNFDLLVFPPNLLLFIILPILENSTTNHSNIPSKPKHHPGSLSLCLFVCLSLFTPRIHSVKY